MKEDLSEYRSFYEKGSLSKDGMDPNPMQQFRTWFFEAENGPGGGEVNAVTLSTLGEDGFPKGRVVLLKKYDEYGFYFYTNYKSEKGRSIAHCNKVSLLFFWPHMERQVIIKGEASRTSEDDSTNYFHSRPKGSQLSALVSDQSREIDHRDLLEKDLIKLAEKYKDIEIPKPEHWGGYLVRPVSMEFWQGRPNRLHDRILYTLNNHDWEITRLQP